MDIANDCIVPEWPAPACVRAFITTRAGGVSTGPYASLNLGLRTEDDPAAVAENRLRLSRLLPQPPRWLQQVHGSTVVDADSLNDVPQADASVARHPGTVCAIMVADCLPILLADRAGIPMPRVYIVDRPEPNAFATGRDPKHAAIAVTTALASSGVLKGPKPTRTVPPEAVPR
jgi:hypothetical protein